MIKINKKEECMGCYACAEICPVDCISMAVDSEGFW
ncbi:MAG: 4Fe-4S binding protein, partial [Clostridiaceae bacterium]|nr:4Fe-4S binding protein [Clostridiaceae bacterium]